MSLRLRAFLAEEQNQVFIAIDAFKELIKFYPSESELYLKLYKLLKINFPNEARKYLKLGVQYCPNYALVSELINLERQLGFEKSANRLVKRFKIILSNARYAGNAR